MSDRHLSIPLFTLTIVVILLLGLGGCAEVVQIASEALELHPEQAFEAALSRSPEQWASAVRAAETQHEEIVHEYGALESDGRLQHIAEKLVAASHFKGLPVKVFVVPDDSLNAFNTGGPHIYVNAGLLRRAGSEDEVAFILGHELGHAMANHPSRQTGPRLVAAVTAELATLIAKGERAEQVIALVHQAFTSAYSRRHEREADVLGVLYASEAGYDPLRGAEFFRKAAQEEDRALAEIEQALRQADVEAEAADRACDQANQQYQASRSPYDYQVAVEACDQQNLAADRYNELLDAYKASALGLSPLFRIHPVNADRIQALADMVAAMRTDSVASTAEWAYAFRVASSVLRRTNEGPTTSESTAVDHQRTEGDEPVACPPGTYWMGKGCTSR
jgi:Zn-dependent protease with chaperone function